MTVRGLAVGGSTMAGVIARADAALALKPEALTILPGANDMPSMTNMQSYADSLFAYTDRFRAIGTKVAVGTTLPQFHAGNPALDADFNNRRRTLRAILLAAVGTRIDAVYDVGGDPVMGADAAPQDKALYLDGLHPTYACGYGCGGQGKMAAIYAPVADKLLGQ